MMMADYIIMRGAGMWLLAAMLLFCSSTEAMYAQDIRTRDLLLDDDAMTQVTRNTITLRSPSDASLLNDYVLRLPNLNGLAAGALLYVESYAGSTAVTRWLTPTPNSALTSDAAGLPVWQSLSSLTNTSQEWIDGDSIGVSGVIYAAQALLSGTADTVVVTDAGHIGVGTSTPGGLVTIRGTGSLLRAEESGGSLRSILYDDGEQDWYLGGMTGEEGQVQVGTTSGFPSFSLYRPGGTDRFDIVNHSTYTGIGYNADGVVAGSVVSIAQGGNVGIGLSTPTSKLHVSGTSDPLRLQGLVQDLTLDSVLVVDGLGVVHWIPAENLFGSVIDSAVSANAWLLSGNSGTNPSTNFLGTTDNQALEVRVNNSRALRIEPRAISPNILGGYSGNLISTGEDGNVIAGGGESGAVNQIGNGVDFATIGGGRGNDILSYSSYTVIGGGYNNAIDDSSSYAVIGGGRNNEIDADAQYAVISGGVDNYVDNAYSAVGGGLNNHVDNATYGFIGGGANHYMDNGEYSAILGGENNSIDSGDYVTIAGGQNNVIAGDYSTIAGGRGLALSGSRSFGFLGGNTGANNMSVSAADVAVFGNTDLWLANNDNSSSALRLYEANSTAGAFPGTANYSSFEAQTQTSDIRYLLPGGVGTAGEVLGIASVVGTTHTLDWVSAGGSGSAWLLTGNGSTTAGTNFLGTTNNVSLDFRVNNQRAMRISPNASSPNLIGGYSGNTFDNTEPGNVISGGGNVDSINSVSTGASYAFVGGGLGNVIGTNADRATIVGGVGNRAYDFATFVGGGYGNIAGTNDGDYNNSRYAVVVGGYGNRAQAYKSFIGGGLMNLTSGDRSVVVGGEKDTASGEESFIGGGQENVVRGTNSAIIGGFGLTIAGDRSLGFHGNNSAESLPMSVSSDEVVVFGNTDLWLANNNSSASQLRFYEANSTTGTFPPASTNYTAFRAGAQSANITYTLPTADGASGEVLTTNGSGTLSWSSPSGGSSIDTSSYAFVRKSSQESVLSSSTLQNDNDLFVGLTTNAVYEIECVLYSSCASSSSRDLKIAFTVPTGTTIKLNYDSFDDTDNLSHGSDIITSSGTATASIAIASAGTTVVNIKGLIRTGSTSGNVQLQWAQNSSGTPAVTMDVDSYMIVRRLQ